jgi:hypothetical protein|tara:strand:+ start:169 stop:360 length:192 start_codon:yes stop_codon:yes gene_type:complete
MDVIVIDPVLPVGACDCEKYSEATSFNDPDGIIYVIPCWVTIASDFDFPLLSYDKKLILCYFF